MSNDSSDRRSPKADPLPRRKWLLAGIPLCGVMAVVEVVRALDGHARSIAYAFEWPFFAVFLYYMYWKLGQPLPTWDDEEDVNQSPR